MRTKTSRSCWRNTRTGTRRRTTKRAEKTTQRPRRLPQRTCVACGTTTNKRELLRVVRAADGQVLPDPTGKMAGRGAYICHQPECWEAALKKGRLDRSLKVKVSTENAETLRAYSRTLIGETV